MSDTRERILARLRDSRPHIASHGYDIPGSGAEMTLDERIERFTQRMQAVRAEVHLVSGDAWIECVREICIAKGVSTLLYAPDSDIGQPLEAAWPSDAEQRLVRPEGDFEQWKEEIFFRIDAAVTGCRAGIAETGSLVLWPTAAEPRTFSLVPPLHIAVLDVQRLYNSFAELVEAEQWHAGMPSNALLISGPSKSADIEQTLAYGVHGPTELCVVLRRS